MFCILTLSNSRRPPKYMLYNINGTFFFSFDFYKLQALLRHDDFVSLHRRKVIFIALFQIASTDQYPTFSQRDADQHGTLILLNIF